MLKSPKMSNFWTFFENGLWAPHMLPWIRLKWYYKLATYWWGALWQKFLSKFLPPAPSHWFIWADLGFGNSPLKNAVFSLGRQQLIVFCNLWALENQIWKKFLATEKTAHELWSRVPDVCTQKTFYNRQNEKCYKNGLSLIVFPWRIKWRRRSLEIFATFIFQSHVCC